MRRNFSIMNLKTPLRIGVLLGASSVALVALVVTLATRTVHAYAPLPQPTAVAPLTTPVTSATPTELAPQESAQQKRKDRLRGIASWYGSVFNGRHTASGERFNMYAMTACHPSLPFGTLVRVINLENKKSVIVRITDRGDLVDEGRIIDLSYGAAQKLSMVEAGLASVKLEVISRGRHHRHRADPS
jgi:rare lipoprotein A